jgi:hypothetical protein
LHSGSTTINNKMSSTSPLPPSSHNILHLSQLLLICLAGLNAPRLSVGLECWIVPFHLNNGCGVRLTSSSSSLDPSSPFPLTPMYFHLFLQWAGPHQLAIKLRPLNSTLHLSFFYYLSCIEISFFFLWCLFKQLFVFLLLVA